jgi:hypothetical protein
LSIKTAGYLVSAFRSQKTEDRGQIMDNRGQRTENRRVLLSKIPNRYTTSRNLTNNASFQIPPSGTEDSILVLAK